MDLNRNQFFFVGLLVLLLGLQFRMVGSYQLTGQATKFLAERAGKSLPPAVATSGASGIARKVVEPPDWLGWCMISVGAVFVLHSLAMKRPD